MNITTSVAKLIDSSVDGGEYRVHNRGSVAVALGKDAGTLTAAGGFQVAAGTSEDVTLRPGEELFAVATSGTQVVDVL